MINSRIKQRKIIKPGAQPSSSHVVIGGPDFTDLRNKEQLLEEKFKEIKENAYAEAQKILNEASDQAGLMLQEAKEQNDKLRIQAYEEGFSMGKAEAMMIIKNEMRSILNNSISIMKAIEQEREECLQDEDQRVYKIIITIAKKILQKEITLNPEISRNFIKAAIGKLEHRSSINIFTDYETSKALTAIKNEIIEENPGLENLTFTADANLQAGDMLLESNKERLDLRLESQLEELIKEVCSHEN